MIAATGARPIAPAPLRLQLATLAAWLVRIHTLPMANRLFDEARPYGLLERPFAGYRLALDTRRSNIQRLLFLQGERFVAERHLLRGLLRPGMHVLDVGANIGYYLLLFARSIGSTGSITCIEPEPDNVEELRRNIEMNGLTNVGVHEVAVGDQVGYVTLQGGTNGYVSLDPSGGVRVPLQPIDALDLRRVDFVKIDVEGFEGRVLAGAEKVLQRDAPVLFLEIHPWLLPPGDSVDEVLARVSGIYQQVELFELAPEANVAAKLWARYSGHGVRRIENRARLLAECAEGRSIPFWAIATNDGTARPAGRP